MVNLRKICIDVVKDRKDQIQLNSMELQLIGYSWPEPTRHTIELVVFTVNKEDGYGERIVEVCKIIFEMVLKCKSKLINKKEQTNKC